MNLDKINNSEIESDVFDEYTVKKWYKRCGHINANNFNKLNAKNMVKDRKAKMMKNIECITCEVNKISVKSFKTYASVQTKKS